jgi:hypothetical protein
MYLDIFGIKNFIISKSYIEWNESSYILAMMLTYMWSFQIIAKFIEWYLKLYSPENILWKGQSQERTILGRTFRVKSESDKGRTERREKLHLIIVVIKED